MRKIEIRPDWLADELQRHLWTYKRLAQEAHIHPDTVTHVMKGLPVGYRTAEKIALALEAAPVGAGGQGQANDLRSLVLRSLRRAVSRGADADLVGHWVEELETEEASPLLDLAASVVEMRLGSWLYAALAGAADTGSAGPPGLSRESEKTGAGWG